MRKLVLLCIVFIIHIISITYGVNLSDIDGHWAQKDIERLIESDSINGYEDGTFKPDNNVTVAEFLKILVQYTDYKKVLVGERWPDWYINTAKFYGFILENEFDDYDKEITRNEAVKILSRFIDVSDVKKSNQKFIDVSKNEDVLKLVSLGVINGYEDNAFRGENKITRAETATIICRAMNARKKLVANRKYNINNAEKLTNIGINPTYDSDYSNRYEIRYGKIYFYDSGRYAKLNGFVVDNKNFNNTKIINLIKALIQDDAYVAVCYIPDEVLYDQITVEYGKREGYVYNHSTTFSFTFYPDKPFDLKRSSLNDELSDNCFIKIVVARMWEDSYDLKNGFYAGQYNNQKLLSALKELFNKDVATEIYEYIQSYIPKLYEVERGTKFVEIKNIGEYTINLYTTGNTRVQLYISK